MLPYNSELIYGGQFMNEKNNVSLLRKLAYSARKRFAQLGKGSKILLRIGAIVFFAFLLFALYLSVTFMTGSNNITWQTQLIEWIVLYSFRFWVTILFGALILDILIKR